MKHKIFCIFLLFSLCLKPIAANAIPQIRRFEKVAQFLEESKFGMFIAGLIGWETYSQVNANKAKKKYYDAKTFQSEDLSQADIDSIMSTWNNVYVNYNDTTILK